MDWTYSGRIHQRATVAALAEHFQAKLEALIGQGTVARCWSLLVPIRGGSGRRPLFCVHPGGGMDLCYSELAAELDMQQPIYGLQPQEVTEGTLYTHNSIDEMANALIVAVREVQPHGPYLLAGWSFGGMVAFEMAQQLRDQGEEIAVLALLDSFAPSCTPHLTEQDLTTALISFVGGNIDISSEELQNLDPETRLMSVLRRACELNLIPAYWGAAPPECFIEHRRRLQRAIANYCPRRYDAPMHLFRCRDENHPVLLRVTDPYLGWGPICSGIKLHWVPGDHHRMVHKPYVKDLATVLRQCLSRAHVMFPWP